jgi:hypothetical protein
MYHSFTKSTTSVTADRTAHVSSMSLRPEAKVSALLVPARSRQKKQAISKHKNQSTYGKGTTLS